MYFPLAHILEHKNRYSTCQLIRNIRKRVVEMRNDFFTIHKLGSKKDEEYFKLYQQEKINDTIRQRVMDVKAKQRFRSRAGVRYDKGWRTNTK